MLGACAKKESLVIFSTARAQGNIQASDDCFKKGSCGGFPALKNIYDSESLPKLIVDLGNWSSDTPQGLLTKGKDVIEMMNAFPYSAAVPGITDINLAEKDFDRLIKDSEFPILGTNLYARGGKRKEGISNHSIINVNGHKIGLFSVLLANPKKPESQKNYARFRIEKGSYDANLAINALKKEGAEIIIMLLSVNPAAESDKDYYKNFIDQVSRTNLIITDDPEVQKTFRSGKTWVIPAGTKNKEVSRTEIMFNPDTGKISSAETRMLEIDPIRYKENPELRGIAIKYKIEEDKHFSKKAGTIKAPIPLKEKGLPLMANFAADCIKIWAKTSASLMPINEPEAPLSSTTVTLTDLYKSFPKDSSIVFVKIRGENLLEALKLLKPDEFTVSGLRLFYSWNGKLEKAESATGESIKPDKIYQIAVPDSMITDGNTYLLANAAEFANSKNPTRNVIQWCTASRYNFNPETERMIRKK